MKFDADNLNAERMLRPMSAEDRVRWHRQMKITVPEVLPLAREIYKRDSGGCCLHIFLDDMNMKEIHLNFCINLAREREHGDCETLGLLLKRMTKTQRGKVSKLAAL